MSTLALLLGLMIVSAHGGRSPVELGEAVRRSVRGDRFVCTRCGKSMSVVGFVTADWG